MTRRIGLKALSIVGGAAIAAVATAGVARADVDLTGDWFIEFYLEFGIFEGNWTLEQTGTTLTVTATGGSTPFLTGTIDPMTGDFTVTGLGQCNEPDSTVTGTASSNDIFYAQWDTEIPTSPTFCVPTVIFVGGRRDQCGNSSIDAGEQCDDGNRDAGDCCSPTCLHEPDLSSCDDGNPATTGDACQAGVCTGGAIQESQVNEYTQSSEIEPAVAMSPDGDVVIAWTQFYLDGDNAAVFARRFSGAGSRLGSELLVNTHTAGAQREPSVAMNNGGDFIIVWHSIPGDGGGMGVFGQRYSSEGTRLGTEFQINVFTPANQARADVARNATGDFVVVWQSLGQDGYGSGIVGRRFSSDGTPKGGEFLVNQHTRGYEQRPAVAMGAEGEFAVVWQSNGQDGDQYAVFARRFASNGSPIGSEFQVSAYTVGRQARPDVAGDASGAFVVAWSARRFTTSGYQVVAKRFSTSGAALGPEFTVANSSYGPSPSATMSWDGKFILAWQSDPYPGQTDIIARRYASDGTPIDAAFVLNTYTPNEQEVPAVGMDARGNFVAAWEGETQVGGLFSRDVFARFFHYADGPAIDPFKCYLTRESEGPGISGATVALADQFGVDDGNFEVGRPFALCNPATVNGEPPAQLTEHLDCHKIEALTLPPDVRPSIQVHDAFGDHQLEIKKGAYVCLRSSKQVLP